MDLIDQLTQLAEFPQLLELRHQRAKVVNASQASHDALFDPDLPGLDLHTRLLVAERIAALSGNELVRNHYYQRLQSLGTSAVLDDHANVAQQAALHFAQILTLNPIEGNQDTIATLLAAGLQAPDIITLAQLIGFVTYQLRVIAGLEALKQGQEQGLVDTPSDKPTIDNASFVHPAHLPKPGQALEINGFTSATLGWKAWVPILQLDQATPEQIAILEASHPTAKQSDYYLALAQQPDILRERSAIFNAIMYAPGGMPRAERELASTVVSRVNGCVYCASVHAQRFEQLTKRNDVIAQIFEDPETAGTTPREKAIIRLAIALTANPEQFTSADLEPLYANGLSASEILDGIHSVAIFAWANRLMLNLGEPVRTPPAN